jgi:D-3-phosphoglycerate dehydrogenase
MVKVLISDKMSALAEESFKKHGVDFDVKTGLTPEELKEIIHDYDGLAIRSSTKVTKEILEKATNLKVIARAGIGVDNVDIPAATEHGVIVMNTPFGNSITTAEHAIAMMFAVARQIPEANASTHAGKWEKSKFMGTEVTNKTLGLIGCGNIGAIVAKRALGLQMQVISYDPFLTEEKAESLGVKKVELDELLKEADFITLHVPLNDATKNIISKENIAKLKKTAYIINCARGGLVDEEALKVALEEGKLAGAALDVFAVEPAKENALFGNNKVVMTPHLGASTTEAQENVAVQVAEQISNFLNNNVIENSLNIPSVSLEEAKLLGPYLTLASQLGNFAGQIATSPIKEVKISYFGEATKLNTKAISGTIVKSILEKVIEGVNIVNSMHIAKSRGIEIKDVIHNDKNNYATYVKIELQTEGGIIDIAGTIFAGEPRIVEVNQVRLEASISPNILYIRNQDKPGLIGQVGKLLGDKNINIANFHLGKNSNNDKEAVALIAIDTQIDKDSLEIISNMASVTQATALTF